MKTRIASIVAMTAATSAGSPSATAQVPAHDRGLDIVQEIDRRSRGYGDFEAELLMRIRDERGRLREREMVVRGLEADGGDRTLIVLERPADLAGTAFLSVLGDEGERAQWIYLPTARRVRRIAGSQQGDNFLGSHFTYADMAPPTVRGYDYRWIRDEEVSGRMLALVERRQRTGEGDEPRQLLWVDTDRSVLERVEYFDAEGARTRTLQIGDYREIGGFWRAHRLEMLDAESGGATVLEWSNLRLGVGLGPRDFDPARLGRVR